MKITKTHPKFILPPATYVIELSEAEYTALKELAWYTATIPQALSNDGASSEVQRRVFDLLTTLHRTPASKGEE